MISNDEPLVEDQRKKRVIPGWVKAVIIIYCLVGIAIFYMQDLLLLHPEVIEKDKPYSFTMPFREVNIPFDKNININLVQFENTSQPFKGVILYFHGNRNNVTRYAPFVPALTRHGYQVWMMDYPGFGKSTGEFTEKMVYDWSLIMYNLARKRTTPDSIIIYGKSLGSGIAAQLASIRDCKRLILETPYYSMMSMANTYFWMYPTRWMIKYKIPTYQHLQKVTAPVTFFHGTDDSVIPYSNAKKLQQHLKKTDEFVTLQHGTHNDLNDQQVMKSKLDSLLNL